MKKLFSRQSQLETMTKVCRHSYISSCIQSLIYGSFLTILLHAWQTGEAFFLLESYSDQTMNFVRGWVTFGYILIMVHFFVQMEQIPKYLDVIKSDDPRYDLKKHLDCIRWIGVVCGFTAGFCLSWWLLNDLTGLDARVLCSGAFLMFILILGIGRDVWRMSGLSPSIEDKIDSLTDRYRVARKFCLSTLEHRPFVDVDFDLINRELNKEAII
jgi:hypothetical protein